MSAVTLVGRMAELDAPIGLVTCTECGSLRALLRLDDEGRSATNCQRCGNDSYTDLRRTSER
jgi:uncharacterized paraquat-inducible protein A